MAAGRESYVVRVGDEHIGRAVYRTGEYEFHKLTRALDALGYDAPDLERALGRAAGVENLEERLVPGAIDPVVLVYLEERAAAQ